ncbi:MAG TPA: TIGR03435 family protein [Candidatus Solibacter sp.]|nr:TIGR03435 family protein [Candidatus Solibacter sp.]
MAHVTRLAALTILLTVALAAQNKFTVASVKPSPSRKGTGNLVASPGTVTASNLSLDAMIAAAYGVAVYQVSGPTWLRDQHFDIVAKTDAPLADEDAMRTPLQDLLAERFGLKMHRETRELPALVLTVAKGGPKLQPSDGTTSATLPFKKANKTDVARIAGARLTMPQFADILARRLSRPVLDKTSLTAAYRIRLEWTPDTPIAKSGRPNKFKPAGDLPSIFEAIKDQLGLRLDSQKAQVEVLVIDHISRTPTAN